MTRVLVCGGRSYPHGTRVFAALKRLRPTLVIEGGATGADHWARFWAENNGVALATFPAHWNSLGRKAGPLRNGWMLEFGKPDVVLAFPGGEGTANMVRQACDAGVLVIEEMG